MILLVETIAKSQWGKTGSLSKFNQNWKTSVNSAATFNACAVPESREAERQVFNNISQV